MKPKQNSTFPACTTWPSFRLIWEQMSISVPIWRDCAIGHSFKRANIRQDRYSGIYVVQQTQGSLPVVGLSMEPGDRSGSASDPSPPNGGAPGKPGWRPKRENALGMWARCAYGLAAEAVGLNGDDPEKEKRNHRSIINKLNYTGFY